jgi:hypothetical protein
LKKSDKNHPLFGIYLFCLQLFAEERHHFKNNIDLCIAHDEQSLLRLADAIK